MLLTSRAGTFYPPSTTNTTTNTTPPAVKSGGTGRSTSVRKASPPGALLCRNASVAHYCTGIARKNSRCHCGLFLHIESLRVSACLVTPLSSPPLPPSSPQPAGHTHFHAHKRPSSDMQGAVIYGARSLSVHAGNSNTHGRTAGMVEGGRAHPTALTPLAVHFFFFHLTHFFPFFSSLLVKMKVWCLHMTQQAWSAERPPESVGERKM